MKTAMQHYSSAVPIMLICLPVAVFALYVAYLVVPEVVRIVVPAVVDKVVGL